MIELARFPQPDLARLAQAILQQQGIVSELQVQGTDSTLLLADAARFDEARALLAQWRNNPRDPQFSAATWRAGVAAASTTATAGGSAMPPMFAGWWAGLGPVVKVVLVVTVLVFLSPLLLGDGVYRALLFVTDTSQLASEPWRLFTPMLLHFGLLHILFNLLWWQTLGAIVERFQSSAQLLLVTLLTAALSNYAQFVASGPNFGGLSGVVYGLLGYLWLYGKVNPAAGYGIPRPVVVLMLAWLVICWVGLTDLVANEAHLAGLLSGCVLGALTGWRRRLQDGR